jgi:hypothetical protein
MIARSAASSSAEHVAKLFSLSTSASDADQPRAAGSPGDGSRRSASGMINVAAELGTAGTGDAAPGPGRPQEELAEHIVICRYIAAAMD